MESSYSNSFCMETRIPASLRKIFAAVLGLIFPRPKELFVEDANTDIIIITIIVTAVCCLILISFILTLILCNLNKKEKQESAPHQNKSELSDSKRKFLDEVRRFHNDQNNLRNFNKPEDDYDYHKSHFQRKRMAFTVNRHTQQSRVRCFGRKESNLSLSTKKKTFYTPPPSPRGKSKPINGSNHSHLQIENAFDKPPPKTIILHQYERARNIPCLSPGGFFLESFIRLHNLPYEIVFDCGKEGPWIDVEKCYVVGARKAMKYLSKSFKKETLMPCDQLLTVVAEYHLHWIVMYWRWVVDKGSAVTKNQPNWRQVFGNSQKVAKSVKSTLWAIGMGKLSHSDVINAGIEDLKILTVNIKEKQFFGGNQPSELDCLIFAVTANIYWGETSPLKTKLLELQPLVDHCERMKSRLWTDWNSQLFSPNIVDDDKSVHLESEISHSSDDSSGENDWLGESSSSTNFNEFPRKFYQLVSDYAEKEYKHLNKRDEFKNEFEFRHALLGTSSSSITADLVVDRVAPEFFDDGFSDMESISEANTISTGNRRMHGKNIVS